jgi:hypothetical protein
MPVQKLNKTIRDAIFQQTRVAVSTEQPHLIGNCLEFAWHGYQIIKAFGGSPNLLSRDETDSQSGNFAGVHWASRA